MIWPKRSITCIASCPRVTRLLLAPQRVPWMSPLTSISWDAEVGLQPEILGGLAVGEGGSHVVGVRDPLLQRATADRVGPIDRQSFGDVDRAGVARMRDVLRRLPPVDAGEIGRFEAGDALQLGEQGARQTLLIGC
jgi:hypothetical protein